MKARNLIGYRFGNLTVIERAPNSRYGKTMWICKCDCGRIKSRPVFSDSLISGRTTSCGCKYLISNKGRNTRHGMNHTRIHHIWCSMKRRCKVDPRYKHISVCEEWETFENFAKWAFKNGYSEELTIDRIDNSKGYYPDNCRWVTYKTQANNRRSNHHVTINGITHNMKEWAEISNIPYATIMYRVYHGWDEKDLLIKPDYKNQPSRR